MSAFQADGPGSIPGWRTAYARLRGSIGRVSVYGAEGCGFKSHRSHSFFLPFLLFFFFLVSAVFLVGVHPQNIMHFGVFVLFLCNFQQNKIIIVLKKTVRQFQINKTTKNTSKQNQTITNQMNEREPFLRKEQSIQADSAFLSIEREKKNPLGRNGDKGKWEGG